LSHTLARSGTDRSHVVFEATLPLTPPFSEASESPTAHGNLYGSPLSRFACGRCLRRPKNEPFNGPEPLRSTVPDRLRRVDDSLDQGKRARIEGDVANWTSYSTSVFVRVRRILRRHSVLNLRGARGGGSEGRQRTSGHGFPAVRPGRASPMLSRIPRWGIRRARESSPREPRWRVASGAVPRSVWLRMNTRVLTEADGAEGDAEVAGVGSAGHLGRIPRPSDFDQQEPPESYVLGRKIHLHIEPVGRG
jgi:hypothetical protein